MRDFLSFELMGFILKEPGRMMLCGVEFHFLSKEDLVQSCMV